MLRKIMMALVIFAVFGGCKGTKEAYDKAFVPAWKESFTKSCIGDDSSQEKKDLCTCVGEKAVAELTVEQLSDISYATKYIQDNLISACQNVERRRRGPS